MRYCSRSRFVVRKEISLEASCGNGASRPKVSELRELLANLRNAPRQRFLNDGADALEIRSRGVVDGNFNAAAETKVTNPEKGNEGSGKNDEVEQREPGSNGEVHSALTGAIE